MFHFFPDNYRWSQAALRILFTGGSIGEVGPAVVDLAEASATGDDAEWNRVWLRLAERLASRAEAQAAAGHDLSARDSWLRAYAYYQWASTFQHIDDPLRHQAHQRSLQAFGAFARLGTPPIERVEVPYDGASYPAWLVPPAIPAKGPYPVVIYLPGWESTKEQGIEFGLEVARRGVGVLLCDGPGIGEAVLFRGLVNRHDYEVPVSAALDYLAARPEVDGQRIAVVGSSMGGYRAARAAAFEPRLAAAVAWGAIWDYGAIWRRRLQRDADAELTVPMSHALAVMGAANVDEFATIMENWTLDGHAERIVCPLLVVHGERDVQIPLDDAVRLYQQASSKAKELKVFTVEEGGAAHCQNDNRILAHEYIGDWLVDVLVAGRERSGAFDRPGHVPA